MTQDGDSICQLHQNILNSFLKNKWSQRGKTKCYYQAMISDGQNEISVEIISNHEFLALDWHLYQHPLPKVLGTHWGGGGKEHKSQRIWRSPVKWSSLDMSWLLQTWAHNTAVVSYARLHKMKLIKNFRREWGGAPWAPPLAEEQLAVDGGRRGKSSDFYECDYW